MIAHISKTAVLTLAGCVLDKFAESHANVPARTYTWNKPENTCVWAKDMKMISAADADSLLFQYALKLVAGESLEFGKEGSELHDEFLLAKETFDAL